MCTVIVGYKLFPHHPIVIAANRDELLDRTAEPPNAWDGEPKRLAPKDLLRGGTWIGVNARGLFAALTNRADVRSIGGQESRGELVILATQESCAHDAMLCLTALDARRYNGFNLIVGDEATGVRVIRGDGANGPEHPYVTDVIPRAGSGLVIVSNLGVGSGHSPRAEAIERRWASDRLAHMTPHRGTWQRLLEIHDPYPKPGSEWMKRMASTCIHRPPEDNYGTRSSSFITLNAASGLAPHATYPAEWRYWHRERPKDGPACRGRWDPVRRLAIGE